LSNHIAIGPGADSIFFQSAFPAYTDVEKAMMMAKARGNNGETRGTEAVAEKLIIFSLQFYLLGRNPSEYTPDSVGGQPP